MNTSHFWITLHLTSAFALLLALGASLTGGKSRPKWVAPVHGTALLGLLAAGTARIHEMGLPFPWPHWVWAKLTIWLALGGALALSRNPRVKPMVSVGLTLVLAAMAAYLGTSIRF